MDTPIHWVVHTLRNGHLRRGKEWQQFVSKVMVLRVAFAFPIYWRVSSGEAVDSAR